MQLAFQTRELRGICEDEIEASDALGQDCALALKRALADLRAASFMADLPAIGWKSGAGKTACIPLCQELGLVIQPNHAAHPDVDLAHVNRVMVIQIGEGLCQK